jgi:hypothetical protein
MTRTRDASEMPHWLRQALLLLACGGWGAPPAAGAEAFLVRDGQPQAEIVVAAKPTRTAKLAAAELQRFIRQISGAVLPLVTTPTAGVPVRVCVGRSPETDRLL